jgi:hypothetical protein
MTKEMDLLQQTSHSVIYRENMGLQKWPRQGE